MATVWEAENEAGQRVAIKMLAADFAQNGELVARFFLEARAASFIAHPGIVRVLDTGQTPWGAPFLVMEELVGLSLADLLERHGRFSPAQAVSVLAPILDAVAAAHGAGVIHRDLKPANVFVTLTAVKLLDFGISKVLASDARLTQTGMVFGTPAYMSPEQVRDAKDATPASDVYSVGALAFELLTGAPPFAANNPLALAAKVLSEEAPQLQAVQPELPAALCRIVDRALSKDPALRPPRAHVFKEQLEALVPTDTTWLFSRVRELMSASVIAVTDQPGPSPRREPGQRGGLSLAQLFDRLARSGRRLPAPVAARLAYDLLLDPSTPTTLTPAQVLISPEGRVRAVPGAGLKSQRGARLQSFVAPEAWAGHPSALSLQFSLGAVLFQALTGDAPFEAGDEPGLRARLSGGVTQATWAKMPAELPPSLGPVLERMVAADPLHRYPDAGSCAGELAAPFRASPLFSRSTEELAALSRAALQPPVVTLPPAPPPADPRGVSGVAALLVALLALAGGIGIGVSRLQQNPPVTVAVPTLEETATTPVVPRPLVEDGPTQPLPPSEYAVTSEPPGAALWVDDEFRGNTPGRLTLPQGRGFQLRLELPAHRRVVVDLDADGAPHPLHLRLVSDKTLGRARFDLSDETRLWLDGVLVAQGRVELPVEANVTHHFQLEVGGVRSPDQLLSVMTAEVKTLRPEN
jgi:serine/threonine-protein kinase